MNITQFLIIISFLTLGCQNSSTTQQQKSKTPKLVVGIVVDQMKDEYLRRFEHNFSENGFKRLMKQGYVCRNAHFNYVPTFTGPGHASIYTGTVPANHGIVANDWYNRKLGRTVYCVFDSTARPVGTSKDEGKMSSRNLIANTVGDELKMVTNMRSKVIGISLKDRGAVLPAGHLGDAAYWLESSSGNWISSNQYFDELPGWVQAYNEGKHVQELLGQKWTTQLPIEAYHASLPDENEFEGALMKDIKATFPYDLPKISSEKGLGIIKSTPFGNSLVVSFAQETIINESLGQDDYTDLLAVSFSSTDYVGHIFGPNSVELEDTYVRLDSEIDEFLEFLDREVGKDNYLIFLTSDHGVSPSPLHMKSLGLNAGHYNESQLMKSWNNELQNAFDWENIILRIEDLNVYLNHALLDGKKDKKKKIIRTIERMALEEDWIKDIYVAGEFHKYKHMKSAQLISNGYWRKRSGDLIIQARPYWLYGGYSQKGTSHGSAYEYDTHAPLIWYGTGIGAGEDFTEVAITDIAPTLSMLISSNAPNSCSGKVIQGLFKK